MREHLSNAFRDSQPEVLGRHALHRAWPECADQIGSVLSLNYQRISGSRPDKTGESPKFEKLLKCESFKVKAVLLVLIGSINATLFNGRWGVLAVGLPA
ncbi:hypothetical protein SLA2020_406800 [Shorea laevis]